MPALYLARQQVNTSVSILQLNLSHAVVVLPREKAKTALRFRGLGMSVVTWESVLCIAVQVDSSGRPTERLVFHLNNNTGYTLFNTTIFSTLYLFWTLVV